jgi:hypothetical protein
MAISPLHLTDRTHGQPYGAGAVHTKEHQFRVLQIRHMVHIEKKASDELQKDVDEFIVINKMTCGQSRC